MKAHIFETLALILILMTTWVVSAVMHDRDIVRNCSEQGNFTTFTGKKIDCSIIEKVK